MDHDHWYELADDEDIRIATAVACNGVIDKAMKGRYYLRQTSFQSFHETSRESSAARTRLLVSIPTSKLLALHFQHQEHSHTMPDSTVDSATTTAPPTTTPLTTTPSTTTPLATTRPDSDDGFFGPAKVIRRYGASYCPKGIVTCSEVDGSITDIEVAWWHPLPENDYAASMLAQVDSLRDIALEVWGEEVEWLGRPAKRPESPNLPPFQGTVEKCIKDDEDGSFSGAMILANMTEILDPPSSLFRPGSDNNKAYICTIVKTLKPLTELMSPVYHWVPNQPRTRYKHYGTGEWTDVPLLDRSSTS